MSEVDHAEVLKAYAMLKLDIARDVNAAIDRCRAITGVTPSGITLTLAPLPRDPLNSSIVERVTLQFTP